MDPSKSKVKRCLWPVDHEELNNDLNAEMEKMNQQESKRMQENWNFNPENDTALEGRFQWEKTQCGGQSTTNEKSQDAIHKEMKVECQITTNEQTVEITPKKT